MQNRLQGLRGAWASNAVAQVDFDAVCYGAAKMRSHIAGFLVELEYSQGGTRQ